MRYPTLSGALAGVFVMVAAPVVAFAQVTVPITPNKTPGAPVIFALTAHSQTFDPAISRTTRKGGPITDIELTMPEAVQLDGEVPADVAKLIGANRKSPVDTGSILLLWGADTKAFCGPARFSGLDKIAPCLIDSDNDSRFDAGFRVVSVALGPPTGIVISNSKIMGTFARRNVSLPEPVPYHPVERAQIPKMNGQISWASDYKAGRTGPVKLWFGFTAAGAYITNDLISTPVEVEFSGAPVTIDIYGIALTIDNIGADGDLVYRMGGELDPAPIPFEFQVERTMHLYVYIP